jgi:hypothetical protein
LADFPHQHLKIRPKARDLPFQGSGRGNFQIYPRTREQHAAQLLGQIAQMEQLFAEEKEVRERVEAVSNLVSVEAEA